MKQETKHPSFVSHNPSCCSFSLLHALLKRVSKDQAVLLFVELIVFLHSPHCFCPPFQCAAPWRTGCPPAFCSSPRAGSWRSFRKGREAMWGNKQVTWVFWDSWKKLGCKLGVWYGNFFHGYTHTHTHTHLSLRPWLCKGHGRWSCGPSAIHQGYLLTFLSKYWEDQQLSIARDRFF